MFLFWFVSVVSAQETDVFSRLLIEESIPSNQFLSDRKIEIEHQMAWNSQIEQFGSFTQISIFPIEPLQLSLSAPVWIENDFRGVDISIHGKYIVVGDEDRWNVAAGSGVTQTKNEGLLLTPSFFLQANSSQNFLQSYWKLGGVSNMEEYGFHLMGMTGIRMQRFLVFGQVERMRFGKRINNWVTAGSQIEINRWNLRGQVATPSFLNPRLGSLRYSIDIEFYPKINDRFADTDNDGIWNRSDICPNEREDIDGFKDSDGCPDLDNDVDTILDEKDRCPFEKEDFDGFQDDDGCPDIDNDQDGILDNFDRCPEDPETINSFKDSDGCPERHSQNNYDGDLVPDHQDKCPYNAEDIDGFQDDDGCPDIDNDHDGVLDADE